MVQLESIIGHTFHDRALLERALTHRSFAHENRSASEPRVKDYENMEFLGDSVLGLVISEYLFRTFPGRPEGELSMIKSFLVSTAQLAVISRRLELGRFLRLSHGEEKTGGRTKRALLADLFESLTAAVYLDGGLLPAQAFVLRHFQDHFQKLANKTLSLSDFKSRLQEHLHSRGLPSPRYRVVREQGPDHRKEFSVEVQVKGDVVGQGKGRSKKEAEQRAAEKALQALREQGSLPAAEDASTER